MYFLKILLFYQTLEGVKSAPLALPVDANDITLILKEIIFLEKSPGKLYY